MTNRNETDNSKCCQVKKQLTLSYIAGGKVQSVLNTVWQFLKRLNIELLYNPAVLPLDLYSREMPVYVPTEVYACMLMAAIFGYL